MKEGIKGEYFAFSEVLRNCTNNVRRGSKVEEAKDDQWDSFTALTDTRLSTCHGPGVAQGPAVGGRR